MQQPRYPVGTDIAELEGCNTGEVLPRRGEVVRMAIIAASMVAHVFWFDWDTFRPSTRKGFQISPGTKQPVQLAQNGGMPSCCSQEWAIQNSSRRFTPQKSSFNPNCIILGS